MSSRTDDRLADGAPLYWPELDVLRALAAALMVLNHVAVDKANVLSRDPEIIATMAFIGGFAPVVFFFLTGLGYGVQSVGRPAPRGHGYVLKVMILIAADVMLWVAPGSYIGLNFFGIIGLSMLLLEWARRAPRSGALAMGLAVVVVVCRYAIGPLFRSWIEVHGGDWLKIVLGSSPPVTKSFPYPLGPWLAYPLVGYSMGRMAAWRRDPAVVRRPSVVAALVAVAAIAACAAAALAARGETLNRFGQMTHAYFVASVSALATSLALVITLGRFLASGPIGPWVTLSGVRSFAVVPLHYALLILCDKTIGPADGLVTFARNVLLVLILSFALSTLVPDVAARLNTPRLRTAAWTVVPVAFVGACLILIEGKLGGGSGQAVRTVIQLALCVLLIINRPSLARLPSKARETGQVVQTAAVR